MEEMIKAFRVAVLQNYARFAGRAGRAEFWWYCLAVFLLNILVNLIDAFVISPVLGLSGQAGLLSAILGLALILPGLAVTARRLHDTGRSGWWQLLWLLPLVGFIVLIVFCAQKGVAAANRFGPPPPALEGPDPV